MKTERPSDEEMKELIEVYGPPSFKERQVHLEDLEYEDEKLESKGDVVIEVKKDGKVLGVRTEDEKFVLPQGKVSSDEGLIEGAKRIVFEKTNLKVEVISLKEISRTQIKFSDELVERWCFLFETEIIEGTDEKFKDVKFLDEVSREEEYHRG